MPLWMVSPELRHQQTVVVLHIVDFVETKSEEDLQLLFAGALNDQADGIMSGVDQFAEIRESTVCCARAIGLPGGT